MSETGDPKNDPARRGCHQMTPLGRQLSSNDLAFEAYNPSRLCSNDSNSHATIAAEEASQSLTMLPQNVFLPLVNLPDSKMPVVEFIASDAQDEIRDCLGEDTRDILMHLPPGMNRLNATLRPGGLPLDVWYLILDNVDDLRTWRTCELICKVLASRVLQVTRDLRRRPTEEWSATDLQLLRHTSARHPVTTRLLNVIRIRSLSTTRFVYGFAGRLPSLVDLYISNWEPETNGPLPYFQPNFLAALSRFSGLRTLYLSNITFQSHTELVRFICAFPKLIRLNLENVLWKQDSRFLLADEPFAKRLQLHEIKITDEMPMSKYKNLLSAPLLAQSVIDLSFEETESSGGIYCRVHIPSIEPAKTSTKASDGVSEQQTKRQATVTISLDPDATASWLRTLVALLDDFLAAANNVAWRVDVEIIGTEDCNADVLDVFFRHLPFPNLTERPANQIVIRKEGVDG